MPSTVLGAVLALISALVWGSGDFVGGQASRRAQSMHVLIAGGSAGLILLVILAAVWQEGVPDAQSIGFGALAGLMGLLGLALLYYGLSRGAASVVAPVSTVVAQAIPVMYVALGEGLPAASQLLGFALAACGSILVSRGAAPGAAASRRASLITGVVSGLGFGVFLIVIGWTNERYLFGSLASARATMIAAALAIVLVTRGRVSAAAFTPAAYLSGVLDALGNALYLVAKQFTRQDIAVVLSSLYPISTIILSRILLKENIAPVQWAGIAVCAIAVALIVA